MKMKALTKTISSCALVFGLLTCGAAHASGITSFATMAEVDRFCRADNIDCKTITETTFGYTVFYETYEGINSGPRRGDGDGDPLDGGNG